MRVYHILLVGYVQRTFSRDRMCSRLEAVVAYEGEVR